MDQKTDLTKLWRTSKGINGRAKRTAENEAITFNGISFSSHLPPAASRWLSCYLRGRQTKSCFRGVTSPSRKVNTRFPQGSKLPPSLFSFYMSDMPMPTEPVKRVCYADDLTVWATGVKIPDRLNSYLEEITACLKDNSILISAPKSSVTLFTPDIHQAKNPPENTHRGLTATSGTMPKAAT